MPSRRPRSTSLILLVPLLLQLLVLLLVSLLLLLIVLLVLLLLPVLMKVFVILLMQDQVLLPTHSDRPPAGCRTARTRLLKQIGCLGRTPMSPGPGNRCAVAELEQTGGKGKGRKLEEAKGRV